LGIIGRNRVFSENIVPPPKNCEKPGFFGFEAWPETGFLRKFFVTAEAIAKNPVSLVLRCGQKPGFFQNSL